jgi:DHA1 family bicyclomycin/chloramphenicol resistance-like MFS transporter
VTILASPEVVPAERPIAGQREFIALVISLMAMGALAIDLMLPAFPDMRVEFGMAADSSQVSWIVTAFFLGMAIGPWFWGPASDRFGRRAPLFIGMGVYVASAIVATLAPSFGWVIAARILWGIGAAAPRSLAVAMIRDRYEGDAMARLMSLIMAVFLLVPIVAPTVGAGLNAIAPWRVVFWAPAVIAAGVSVWAFKRLPETLAVERRRPFNRRAVTEAAKVVVTNRQTMCFTLAITCLFAVMTGYLASSELIIEDVYGYGHWFPLFFGAVAILLAVSSLNNARLVSRMGITLLVRRMAVIGVAMAALLTVVSFMNDGKPNFWLFSVVLALTVPLAQGTVPNANTAAMLPVPHVAGTASAIIATITIAGGAVLGGAVASAFDGTVRPFAVGTLIFMSLSAVLILFGATTRAEAVAETASRA